ncbi:MAG: flagellar biosynthetic protein FliO [Terracidiphilus sp.]
MGVFASALSSAVGRGGAVPVKNLQEQQSFRGWLLDRFRRRSLKQPRLALVERISLAPRQIVSLIEADGQRLLVATSPDGAASFYPLKPAAARPAANRRGKTDLEAASE